MPQTATCHSISTSEPTDAHGVSKVALVGAPNVGKSLLFNRLTGGYATVSNYPGTSVEVVRGSIRAEDRHIQILDTPGLYSLMTTTEEERVTQRIVLSGEAEVLVHVIDCKSLPRMLPLTLQLLETGLPLVLALNMSDEAERIGLDIDTSLLSERLGIEVVTVSAIQNRGIIPLKNAILKAHTGATPNQVDFDDKVNGYRRAVERQRQADDLLADVITRPIDAATAWRDRVGDWLASPLIGIPFLLLVLYVGLYKFVGQFGAGTMVDLIEHKLFEAHINPYFERFFSVVPWEWLRALFVGEYGVLTLGVRYAVAIILPIVGTFFVFFSILEDSGYFPRLALLVDRGFKRIGLSGRAVIPMVLGFACDTMATMVTRTLETKRERVLATMLLALAIPCSAQLGVILAILSSSGPAFIVWLTVVLLTFVFVGWLSAKVVPGERPTFHMEIPPLRTPKLSNVALKTYTRMHWYFLEVLPLFLFASVMLWLGDLTGAFQWCVNAMAPVVHMLGLPTQTASMFLFGFFRRDYGAAGLFEMSKHGVLNMRQITVCAVTLTLFVPCIAQFLMTVRERGKSFALGMVAFITPFSFGVGALLNILLKAMGWA